MPFVQTSIIQSTCIYVDQFTRLYVSRSRFKTPKKCVLALPCDLSREKFIYLIKELDKFEGNSLNPNIILNSRWLVWAKERNSYNYVQHHTKRNQVHKESEVEKKRVHAFRISSVRSPHIRPQAGTYVYVKRICCNSI